MRKPSAVLAKSLLTASLAAAGTVAAATFPAAAASAGSAPTSATTGQTTIAPTQPQPARLELPQPTGRYPVGTVQLHLVDRSRANPCPPATPRSSSSADPGIPARSAQMGYRVGSVM
jgi:hypothetical protein